jgi:hypothetical protein
MGGSATTCRWRSPAGPLYAAPAGGLGGWVRVGWGGHKLMEWDSTAGLVGPLSPTTYSSGVYTCDGCGGVRSGRVFHCLCCLGPTGTGYDLCPTCVNGFDPDVAMPPPPPYVMPMPDPFPVPPPTVVMPPTTVLVAPPPIIAWSGHVMRLAVVTGFSSGPGCSSCGAGAAASGGAVYLCTQCPGGGHAACVGCATRLGLTALPRAPLVVPGTHALPPWLVAPATNPLGAGGGASVAAVTPAPSAPPAPASGGAAEDPARRLPPWLQPFAYRGAGPVAAVAPSAGAGAGGGGSGSCEVAVVSGGAPPPATSAGEGAPPPDAAPWSGSGGGKAGSDAYEVAGASGATAAAAITSAGEKADAGIASAATPTPTAPAPTTSGEGGGGGMGECVVCCAAGRDTVFMPCRHLACCGECGAAVAKCPLCRAVVDERVRVFV